MTPDEGHDALITDLEALLQEAENFEFHDYKNPTHAFPKLKLSEKLLALRQNVVEGKYDNHLP